MMKNNSTGYYLDEAFELVVLCQQLCLFLLQGEDVVRCLLQDGRLAGTNPKKIKKIKTRRKKCECEDSVWTNN